MKQSKPANRKRPVTRTVEPSTKKVDDCLRQGLVWHDELIEARKALALAKPALINAADVLDVVRQHAAYLGVEQTEIVKWQEKCREAHAAIMQLAAKERRLSAEVFKGSATCLDCGHPLTDADRQAPVCPYCGSA